MILEVQGLSKEFRKDDTKICAVNNASFDMYSGEFASIIGHSGSGKSTLFHMITGLLKPTSGKIIINKLNLKDVKEKELAKLRNETIGYILQEQNLLANFTVLENVCMPYHTGSRKKQENINDKAEELLKKVGLLSRKNSFPHEISGGEARRAAIARALINDPAIIIADEPTSNLDYENSSIIMKLFKKISESGVAVLISTHDIRFLEYSDKVFFMKKGNLEKQEKIYGTIGNIAGVTYGF